MSIFGPMKVEFPFGPLERLQWEWESFNHQDRRRFERERAYGENERIPVEFVTAVKKVDEQTYLCEHSPERLFSVHPPHQCATQAACPVHRKTQHAYRGWRQTWEDLPGRTCRRFMRRVCTHGRWVVDPDEPFKPTCEAQVQLGMQDCPTCNIEHRRVLWADMDRVVQNIKTVHWFLDRGDLARVITIVERIRNGKEHEVEFFPDEALLYLWVCVAELEDELSLTPGAIAQRGLG